MFTNLLEAEIRWCEKNKESMPAAYRNGFIAGLKQAVYLINSARQRFMLLDDEASNDIVLQESFGLTLDAPVASTTEALIQAIDDLLEAQDVEIVSAADAFRFLRERLRG